MAKRVNRRIFLRGLGGACLAAPFLSSITDRAVQAQPAAWPKRLIVMYTHYGCITTRFFPKKSHGPLTAADLESTTLKHLAPHVDKLLMPRSIRAMNEWTATMARGQGNDRHTQVNGSYFTCHPVTPNSDDPFSFDQATKFNAKPTGPSLDHVIARQLSPQGTPLLLNTAGQRDNAQSAISYSAAETLFRGLNASQAFSSLTGLFAEGEPTSPDTYAAMRGKSVLDLVKDDLQTLERFDMSRADKQKLAAWKELVHATGTVVASPNCTTALATALGATQENVDLASTTPAFDDYLTRRITDSLDGADLCSNLAVLAAACNATPVIFLKYPGNYLFKGLGMTQESASLSGRLDNAGMVGTCVPGVIDMLLKIDDYYARKFAHLVEQLNRIDEGDGTLLDNCAAVWFQDASDGCARNLNNMPIVQVGSAGGYFKTGWAVNVEDGSPDLTAGNSEITCVDGGPNEVDGISQATGTDPSLANAPINKYFCSLMSALGVKAGPDGFPAPGGSAPVTHFGMYDRTEDFIGGGIHPPTIHDPGEFTALKASS
ncbi:Tat pathway signal sequence [Sorangium cellulosum]|uniref:Tat pathway signal sequence n=1 Tax=Sorangium cellulosum TaxID=56 RepID=A0A150TBX9_SORCE|nr:Tat pathway signal sequence [Sorangium cellulosum]